MSKHLCIHGHFYQPPRENPWLDAILPEGSAAPLTHWNERILHESYGPLAWARRKDASGRITELVNCYEWMSFNFGPTLLKWMERDASGTYRRVLEADAASLARWGHGNGLAQVQHHVIMPLASRRDKQVEVAWAMADFTARFGRRPEGFWLSEAAVDTETLEVLAEQGVLFTVLAPRQAGEVSPIGSGEWTVVDERSLDVGRPYLCSLPSGRDIAVFFYHGDLSQAVAFERLLEDGERFWNRLSSACAHLESSTSNALLSIATDGETYGHHFTFGEMALAFVLAQTRFDRDEITLTNYGRFLRDHPPRHAVRLREPSSWSCVHGVERWRADCGCTTGGPADWNQKWRVNLRRGLDRVKEQLDSHFQETGCRLFRDCDGALLDFGRVMAGSLAPDRYAAQHFRKGLSRKDKALAWSLLVMEQWGLASFASCAWFFEDISRIEPLGGLTFALRAMDLCKATGGPDPEPSLLAELEQARSNIPSKGTGRDLYENEVLPRRMDRASLCAFGLLMADASGRLPEPGSSESLVWPGVRLTIRVDEDPETAPRGSLSIAWSLIPATEELQWQWDYSEAQDVLDTLFRVTSGNGRETDIAARDLPFNARQAIARARIKRSEAEVRGLSDSLMFKAAPLFPAFQEGQATQTLAEEWGYFWPSLALAYVRGVRLDKEGDTDRPDLVCPNQLACLVRFLAAHGESHPSRTLVGRRIGDECLELLNRKVPSLSVVEGMLARCDDIGVKGDWWRLQNRLWELASLKALPAGDKAGLARIMALAGFAPSS